MYYVTNFFAQAYGACTYDSGSYQNDSCSASTPTAPGSTDSTSGTSGSAASGGPLTGGILTNTGFDIAVAVTLASAIMFVALLVRFWKQRTASVKALD